MTEKTVIQCMKAEITKLQGWAVVPPVENFILLTLEWIEEHEKETAKELVQLNTLLNPRVWTKEMIYAWHSNIPDIMKAFEALRNIRR